MASPGAAHLILMFLSFLIFFLESQSIVGQSTPPAVMPITRPSCDQLCGDEKIYYPFGLTKGCYLSKAFHLTCNHTFNPPSLTFANTNVVVSNISLQGQVQVLQFVAHNCYAQNGTRVDSNSPFLRLHRQFTLNNTENRFVVVGCDTYAFLRGTWSRGRSTTNFTTGCLSICESLTDIRSESCTGGGCCQTSIPEDVWLIKTSLKSFSNHTRVYNFNPCSYAFVVKNGEFKFSSSSLRDLRNIRRLPAVLDWTIGRETCEWARKNSTSYACKSNSKCYEPKGLVGYRCDCLEGFRGNPYLDNGCQDDDECKDPKLNDCVGKCINNIGNPNYTCLCPKGYRGDGRKSGTGCVRKQSFVIHIIVGVGTAVIVLLVGSILLYFGIRRRKLMKMKEKFFKENGGLLLQQQLAGKQQTPDSMKIFSAEELKDATNNYDKSRIVGLGGYGTVYKGFLANKRIVAIKKSKVVDTSQIDQFINEVVVLSQINHRNVVKLLGCCLETQVPLLVYEFINNGTLFEHIDNKSKSSSLSWDIRLRIAAETAGVLSYLHSSASIPIIHRDIKSSNILLDENCTAKVSDFGASKLVPMNETQLSTMVQGTLGYLDPEYLQTSELTEKSDVYSFGVVLVELLTGKKAQSFSGPKEQRSLAIYFLLALKGDLDQFFQILDKHIISGGNNHQQLKEVANLAKKCLAVKGEDRPSMMEVTMELEGLRIGGKRNHSWNGAEPHLEEMESLLGVRTNDNGYVGSSDPTSYCDSMKDHMVLSMGGGR